jgi:glycosyltransferase involved in cell wall biosynthesis
LRLIGPIQSNEREIILEAVESLRKRQAIAEITVDDRFVSDEELDSQIAEADVLLTLYERSFGSSGTVIRAAAFGRPVISTNEGLVGHLVRAHRLGAAVDVRDRGAVAEALRNFIDTGVIPDFDSRSAFEYACSCAPPVFAAGILSFRAC